MKDKDKIGLVAALWIAVCGVLSIAWVLFLVWAIYTLVSWAVTK